MTFAVLSASELPLRQSVGRHFVNGQDGGTNADKNTLA